MYMYYINKYFIRINKPSYKNAIPFKFRDVDYLFLLMILKKTFCKVEPKTL